jgi:hypothetical protein
MITKIILWSGIINYAILFLADSGENGVIYPYL